jgi:hypothetical protein
MEVKKVGVSVYPQIFEDGGRIESVFFYPTSYLGAVEAEKGAYVCL